MKFSCTTAVIIGAALVVSGSAFGQGSDAILDLLIKKGVITQHEANEVREQLQSALSARREELEEAAGEALLDEDWIDLTLPGRALRAGSLHPFTIIEYEISDIFSRMGYQVVEGPEVEDEWHNFDALNILPDHPARTSMDTTYLDVPGHPELLLRTHTSPMQIRTMEAQQPPIYVVVPGRVFRNEEVTAKNMPVFHQVEGLVVDEGITFADLKGTLETFYRALLGEESFGQLARAYWHAFPPSRGELLPGTGEIHRCAVVDLYRLGAAPGRAGRYGAGGGAHAEPGVCQLRHRSGARGGSVDRPAATFLAS